MSDGIAVTELDARTNFGKAMRGLQLNSLFLTITDMSPQQPKLSSAGSEMLVFLYNGQV